MVSTYGQKEMLAGSPALFQPFFAKFAALSRSPP